MPICLKFSTLKSFDNFPNVSNLSALLQRTTHRKLGQDSMHPFEVSRLWLLLLISFYLFESSWKHIKITPPLSAYTVVWRTPWRLKNVEKDTSLHRIYCKSRKFRTHSIFVVWALRPFVCIKCSYSRGPLRILWLALYLSHAFYFHTEAAVYKIYAKEHAYEIFWIYGKFSTNRDRQKRFLQNERRADIQNVV